MTISNYYIKVTVESAFENTKEYVFLNFKSRKSALTMSCAREKKTVKK